MMTGKPAEVVIEDTGYNSHLMVKMEGAPMDIEALCNASSCTVEANTTIDETVYLEQLDSEWSGSATFSLVALVVIIGASLFLSLCFFVSYLMGRKNASKTEGGNNYNDNSQPISQDDALNDGTSQVLQFSHIDKTVRLKSDAAKAHGKKKRKILDNISGSVKSGTLMGIMGPR